MLDLFSCRFKKFYKLQTFKKVIPRYMIVKMLRTRDKNIVLKGGPSPQRLITFKRAAADHKER